ncbi:sporulation protein [Anaerobacillus alkaliphilus]|uniref:Sporulation protein n=1 Tax=Anaerobacillus alkaliphilus TaxID=1548597 RepID=A0A4V1LGI8_9BACI|nr:YhcN/YlaJ family sporulation lipoprotein [Anaerobacillus alkaliphilus]RXJ01814.1 sporulation protein [Anaerobacillus alkaliphilus]
MKKLLLAMAVSIVLVATGCQAMMENSSPIAQDNQELFSSKNRSGDTTVINPDRNYHDVQRFGYVRHQRETALPRGGVNPHVAVYDPELLADAISKLAVLIPDVNEVATLVTASEVLIAYDTTTTDRFQTADQVKRTAISCVPRYFHVYVSDNPEMMDTIGRYRSLTTRSENVNEVLEQTIHEMLQSPQGRRVDASENENGEYDINMNSYMDKKNHNDQIRHGIN